MWRARALSAAIVVAAVAVAYAAVGGLLGATPDVVVVAAPTSTASQGSSALVNPGTGGLTVSAITRLPCDDPGMIVASPAGPFTVASGSQQTVVFDCPASSAYGMRRCTYHAQSAAPTELATFMGVCETVGPTTLAVAPASIDFPSVVVGTTQSQTVTITNNGTATVGTLQLQATDLDGNVLIGAPCNPNANGCDVANTGLGSFTVDILCHPSAVTTYARQLHVVDQFGDRLSPPLAITCTGTAAADATIHVSSTPSPLDVGPIEVLGGSATGAVHISNVGPSGTLTINSIAISGAGTDWTYTIGSPCSGALPCALSAGETVDVAVKLTPSTLGARNATMTIASTDPANSQVAVQLAGIGQGATLELAPGDLSNIDLGQVPKNGSASLQIHLANHGNRDVTDVSLALAGAGQLTTTPASPTSSFTVARGATPTAVTLTCAPGGMTGPLTTTLTASAADTTNNTPVVITATCHGTDSLLDATPTALQLGEVRTGTAPAPSIAFSLDNVGSGAMTLAGPPALAPDIAALSLSGPTSLVLAGNGSAAVRLTIDPASDGDLTTTITAADSSGNNNLTIPVTGQLVTATVDAPPMIELGTFCVNEPTTPTTLALATTGTGSVVLASAHMAAAPSSFQISPQFPSTYPAQLVPGASAVVDVSPMRQSTALLVTDDLVWATDANSPHTTVSAEFLAAGAAIAPASLAFGPQSIHLYVKNAQPVTIQNCNYSGPTLSLHPSIDAPFSIDSDFPSQLVAAETATFAIGFHPTKQGMFTGHLHITTSAMQTLDIALSGIGSANAPPDDGGSSSGTTFHDTSFYACSCTAGGPGGVIPVALALVCVLFPRRRRARP
jgi:uncharacterized protein (TIGR03382 family)